MAGAPELKLREGDKAPDFAAPTHGGGHVSLSDFKGKDVVLYFYPKDDTPGCTKEACAFRDHFGAFQRKGAVVLGVSVDSVKSHDKFAKKFKLPFTLVSDADRKIVQAYGVWGVALLVEAESLLTAACKTILPRARNGAERAEVERFVQLYETWEMLSPDRGKSALAVDWKKILEALPPRDADGTPPGVAP